MTGRKAQATTEQAEKTPERKETADLHRMLAGIREQMEYMLRDQFAAVEAALQDRLADRDARIAAADALIERLREESAVREAEAARQAETLAKLRQLALEST